MIECGECTLCCELFPVKWLEKPAWTACKHCDKGCIIQKTKDEECINFDCAYRQMDKAHISLRPDKCGIIFEKITDDIMFGTISPHKEPTQIVKEQIRRFVLEGVSVILSKKGQKVPIVFEAKGYTKQEVYTKAKMLAEQTREKINNLIEGK